MQFGWLKIVLVLSLAALTTDASSKGAGRDLKPQAISSICSADVIMVGEPSHGLRLINDARAALAQRLIEACKPTSVLFEADYYEFAQAQRAFNRGRISSEQILQAIGPFARNSSGMTELAALLATKVRQREIIVGGLDYQLGTLDHNFTNRDLPRLIANASSGYLRTQCLEQLTGPMQGSGTVHAPMVHQCLENFTRSSEGQLYRGEIRNLRALLAFWSQPLSPFGRHRSQAMFANLLLGMPKGQSKFLVLAHNSHISNGTLWRGQGAENDNLGALLRNAGLKVFSLAITTKQSSFQDFKDKTITIAQPPSDSIEADSKCQGMSTYIDKKGLETLGLQASLLDNLQPAKFAWARAFDGLLVICGHSSPLPRSQRPQWVESRH